MEQPVICVIVPVYKAEATLPRCIESVLTQQLPGGLRLILVDDQSPDRSGEICDAYAAKDSRVMVLHRRERGVSGARNAGLRAATGEYIVFLDSDDALRPGALAAALAAQAAAPNAFVLWHYTMQPDDTTPVTTVAHPAQQSDLARLHLDCLIAMPWNKLYRRTYARQLAFDQAYTLGEDLQFVLDYLALLGRCQPDFSYLVLESALTFYDCSRTGTLSTKYHANYCEIWPKHFAKLNAACTARMIRSNTIMVADTGRWNHLLSTSGGMSMPPVEAPARMVMPSEMPTPRPAKMVLSTRSSVSTKSANTRSHRARNSGLRMVLAMVVRAKRLPSTIQPSTSMLMLMANSTPDTGRPSTRLTPSAMPVAPPVISPDGTRNSTTVSAYSALPAMMDSELKAICCLYES